MIYQSAKMAMKSVLGSKVRSFLTMLGIIIGVFALVVLVSLVEGATNFIANTISGLGSNYLTVSIVDNKYHSLKMNEMDTIMEQGIGLAAPLTEISAMGELGHNSENVSLFGTTSAFQQINGITVAYGTFLRQTDVVNHNYVCVVNQSMAEKLFGSINCLGQTVKLNSLYFTVIGVIINEDNSMTSLFSAGMPSAYIPYTTAQRLDNGVSGEIYTFYLAPFEGDTVEQVKKSVTSFLLERLNCTEDTFELSDMSMIEDALRNVNRMLGTLLGGIAAISLIVGGIGIMNIMLVSVTERTREIGIRKAIGASRGTIMLQFLIEALVLSLVGCIVGIILSICSLLLISHFINGVTFSVSPGITLIAVVFSLAIGLLFGIYPANKAAKKQPIEALRYGE